MNRELTNHGSYSSGDLEVDAPLDVDINGKYLYLADYSQKKIKQYIVSSTMLSLQNDSIELPGKPISVSVDDSGIYVLLNNHTLIKLEPVLMKEIQATFGEADVTGSDDFHLDITPTDDPFVSTPARSKVSVYDGMVYVSDTNNHRVLQLNSSLDYRGEYGIRGSAGVTEGYLSSPSGVHIVSGNVYIADTGNQRLVRTGYEAGFYTSAWINGGTHLLEMGQLTFKSVIPDGASINFEVRLCPQMVGISEANEASATPWESIDLSNPRIKRPVNHTQPDDLQFVQYRAKLQTNSSSALPTLQRVQIDITPGIDGNPEPSLVPETGLGKAINDRLRRATSNS
jgi:hypothetical protein